MKLTYLLLLVPWAAVAQEYNLTLYHLGEDVYKSTSDVTVVVDNDCLIAGYHDVTLDTVKGTVSWPEEQPFIENDLIVYKKVSVLCNVVGTIGLFDAGYYTLPVRRRPVYDLTSEVLYLRDIELWEELQDTGGRVSSARLKKIGTDKFRVEKVE